jgi:adenylate cyclase
VLPFVNISPDPDNEFFSDGITEELLNALTKVDGLQVTSRTSAFAFKGKDVDIRDIAIQLNVDKVLEGSVRKAGTHVRITTQLINAADGYHIWSENYDRNLNDIFEVQDEISSIIANKLRENLSVIPQAGQLVKPPTKNVTAYTHYLKGLHFRNKLTPADMRKAIECFEHAIMIEPGYAQAYAMLAIAYSYLGGIGHMLPHKAFEIAYRNADKALQLDSSVAEGHIAKASAYLLYEWKWQKAYEELQGSIRLNPGAVEAYELLAFYYIVTGQKEQAVQTLEEAEQRDPLSPAIMQSLADKYMFAERYDDGIRQADKLLDMYPQMRVTIETKAWGFAMKGDWEGALKLFEEVHRLTDHPLKGLMGLGYTYAKLGQVDKAMECVRKMEQRQAEEPGLVTDSELAGVWFGLGNLDKTFYYLNQCVDKRMVPVNYFLEYPIYKGIKDDPRYTELMKRTGVE